MDGRDGGLALARLCPGLLCRAGQERPGLRMQEGAPGRWGRGWQSPRSAARTCLPAPGASGCNWAPPGCTAALPCVPDPVLTGETAIRGAGGPGLPPAGEPGGTQGDREARGTESAQPRRPPVTTTTAARATSAADAASRAPRRCVARLDGAGPKAAGAADSRSPVPSALVHPEAPLGDAKWEPWGA